MKQQIQNVMNVRISCMWSTACYLLWCNFTFFSVVDSIELTIEHATFHRSAYSFVCGNLQTGFEFHGKIENQSKHSVWSKVIFREKYQNIILPSVSNNGITGLIKLNQHNVNWAAIHHVPDIHSTYMYCSSDDIAIFFSNIRIHKYTCYPAWYIILN